jgi:hypothetical protein
MLWRQDPFLNLHHISSDSVSNAGVTQCLATWRWNSLGLDLIGFFRRATANDCELLGTVGLAMQIAITVVCAIALISVWLCETPRRPFLTWFFDISKQVVGSAYGKLYNIAQSIVFAFLLRGHPSHTDECVWYLMSIATDCLFLTFLLWGANDFMRPILLQRFGIDIGKYESEERKASHDLEEEQPNKESQLNAQTTESTTSAKLRVWFVQLGVWLAIITVVRLFVSVILCFAQYELYKFYASVFVSLGLETSTQKLVFAVLIFPACADTFQIIVQDHFLKKKQ